MKDLRRVDTAGQPETIHNALLPPSGIVCEGAAVRSNRCLNVLSIGVPTVGTIAAVLSLPSLGVSITTLAVFTVFFMLNAWGLGIGLHRYFTHHAFKTSKAFECVLAVLGSASFQGPIDRWVADHRRHHRYTDCAWDTHSPYWRGSQPIARRTRGLLHAHMGWMWHAHVSSTSRYAPEITPGSIAGLASRNYVAICVTGIIAPAIVGYLVFGGNEALRCALWAGFVRVTLLHHLTWSINSIGHSFGSQVACANDESRNNAFLAFLLLGEGLHSTHHKFPTAGDWNGALLLGLEWAGVIWKLRRHGAIT
jgi:stearoyl-CoA desaturase (Delta-9 desaturase)